MFHVSCFIFILKHETQQWWGVGEMFFFIPPCSSLHKHNNNNNKGNTTNAQEGEKEQQTRGGQEGVLIAHLKGTKTKPDDGGVSTLCHSFLHNTTQEGTHMHTRRCKGQRTKPTMKEQKQRPSHW
jgi:hypothetical protein